MTLLQIKKKINSISSISDTTWKVMEGYFQTETYRPNQKLLHIGDIAKYVYFLHSGLVRSYAITQNGTEFSKSIFDDNNFFAPVTSLVTKKPALLCIETLTECRISKASYFELEKLNDQFNDLSRFHRKQMELLYVFYENSEIVLATQNAAYRYLALRKRIPTIDDRIPQYKIASHLGITNVQLSRIRRNLK
jgi:CRP-like cAMP-binding protein